MFLHPTFITEAARQRVLDLRREARAARINKKRA
jgi:hypothetical protein